MHQIIYVATLCLLFYSLSYVVARNILKMKIIPAERMILGFCISILFLRIPIRENFESIWFFRVLVFFFIVTILYELSSNKLSVIKKFELKEFLNYCSYLIIATLVLSFPLFFNSVFFQHHGPDVYGHLLSIFNTDGHKSITTSVLLAKLYVASGSTRWWDFSYSHWNLPDFKSACGVEFIIRSLRIAHVVLSQFIAYLFSVSKINALNILMASSLFMAFLVVKQELNRFFKSSVFILIATITIIINENYIVMLGEGIVAQLIALPIMLKLVFILRKQNIDWDKQDLILLIIGFLALLSLFAEGLFILIPMFLFYGVIYFISNVPSLISQKPLFKYNKININKNSIIFAVIIILAFGFPYILDFILWSFARIGQNFAGGALSFAWPLENIVFGLPSLTIGINEVITPLSSINSGLLYCISLTVIMLLIVAYIKSKSKDALLLSSIFMTIILYKYNGHLYAIWKVAIFYSIPVLVIMLCHTKNKVMLKYTILGVYIINFIWGCFLYLDYAKYSNHIIDNKGKLYLISKILENYTFATPSTLPLYYKLGEYGPFLWLNSGWGADFRIDNNQLKKAALIVDCENEKKIDCQKIIPQDGFIKIENYAYKITNTSTNTLLDINGVVDPIKLKIFLNKNLSSLRK